MLTKTDLDKKTLCLMVVVLNCEDCRATSEDCVFGSLQRDHLGLNVVVHHLGDDVGPADASPHLQHVHSRLGHAEHEVLCVPNHLGE